MYADSFFNIIKLIDNLKSLTSKTNLFHYISNYRKAIHLLQLWIISFVNVYCFKFVCFVCRFEYKEYELSSSHDFENNSRTIQ